MLKGTATFELNNIKTGETERIVEHNMFTNALNEVYNKIPFGMGNLMLGKLSDSSGRSAVLNPVHLTALGGLLLFPQPIEENANTLFAPASNKPVGIASVAENPSTDPRRGTFNAVESGEITNGYRYVYDFATSQANGTISCVSLTSKWGGETYLDNMLKFLGEPSRINSYASNPLGYSRTIPNHPTIEGSYRGSRIIGVDNTGIYYIGYDQKTIFKCDFNSYILSLNGTYWNCKALGIVDTSGYVFLSDDSICIMRTNGNSSGNASVTIDRYSKADFSKTTSTYTIPAQLRATQNTINIAYDSELDYLYMFGYANTKVFKTKLSNPADTTEITVPNQTALFNCSPFICSDTYIIERDNTVHATSQDIHYFAAGRIGVYALGQSKGFNENQDLAFNVIAPYLATINNLDRAVVKTSDKTMKVTYTVTYGS